MSLGSLINNYLGEVLSLEKLTLSSLASWNNDWYIFDDLLFDPLLDCHEVKELVRPEFHDSPFDIVHKCTFVSSSKPLFIEFSNLLLFLLLFLLFFFFFFTISFFVWFTLLRLRLLFTVHFAFGADASEVGHGPLLLFFLLCVNWFSSFVVRDDLYSALQGKSEEGARVIERVLRLVKCCCSAISDDSGKQCERLHVVLSEIKQILSLSGVEADHLVVQ